MASFLSSLAHDDLAPATLRGYRYDLRHFLAWRSTVQDAPFTIEGLAEYELIAYRQHMVAAGRRPATVNRRLDALRRLCRWARGTGALSADATGNVRPMFFANQGSFRSGDYEEVMNKASCLSLALQRGLGLEHRPHRPHCRPAPRRRPRGEGRGPGPRVTARARQISRWRTARPSADQTRALNRMDGQNQQLRTVTEAVLALADELHKGSIDRIMGMSDIELGLQALLGKGAASLR